VRYETQTPANHENIEVIYVNYNSTKWLIASIDSLYRYAPSTHRLTVHVVDNASSDGVRRLRDRFPDVHLTVNPQNVGFGSAINQALKTCVAEFVILLNPDSIVIDGFLPTSIEYLQHHPTTGILGPMILDDGGGVQGSARTFPTPLTSFFGRNSPITRLYPNNSITRANILTIGSDPFTPMPVDWVSGACMVVRREAIDQVGGFDERFFLYWEDTDLCRRVKDAGWDIVYLPTAVVKHIGARSSNTRPLFSNFHFHKSCYRLYDKYAGWPYSIFTPLAGMALMLRFLIAAAINYLGSVFKLLPGADASDAAQPGHDPGTIRVLRIISRMNIGGPSIHVKNLTENMNPQRFTTRLITGSIAAGEGDMSYIADFGRRVRIPLPELQREISPWHDLMALFKVIREIHRFKPHIVHSHTSKAGTLARLAALVTNRLSARQAVVIHTFHGHVLDGYFSRTKSFLILVLERILARLTDRIIAISNTQKAELSRTYKIASDHRIDTIGLGFDLGPFVHNGNCRGQLRHKLGVGGDTRLVGIVGRMVPIKNHRMFLDAAKQLVDRRPGLNVRFVLVGGGELKDELQAYAHRIGLSDRAVFYGWEKDIPMIYADLDILALTSLNEGTPVSIIEAMAAGVPIVTTGVGGVKDLLGRDLADQPEQADFTLCECGILCPSHASSAFSDALRFLLERDPSAQKRILDNARDHVLKHYSMGRLVRDMERLYEKTIGSRDPSWRR
jgi:GT2 family glycosyltransferase/glycogen synthase